MKKITIQTLILTLILSVTVSELFAQTQIKFAKGQISKTISKIIPESSDDFLEWMFTLRGQAGQTVTAVVKSRSGKVHFTGQGKTQIFRLNDSDEVFIALINDGKPTRFWMTVTIR